MKKVVFLIFCLAIFCAWIAPVKADVIIAPPHMVYAEGGDEIDFLMFPWNLVKNVPDNGAEDKVTVQLYIEPTIPALITRWMCFTPEQLSDGIFADGGFYYYTVPAYTRESVPSEFDDLFSNATDNSIEVKKSVLNWYPSPTATLIKIDYIKFRNTAFIPVPYKE
jgi:hypothetical protein